MASSQSEELFHVKQFVFVQKISTMLTNCGKVWQIIHKLLTNVEKSAKNVFHVKQ